MDNSIFEKDAIMNIQKYLRHLSFHDENIPRLPIDGVWGSQTEDALLAFQRVHGLPQTGIVDRETWDILKAEYDKSVALNSPPATVALFPRTPQRYVIGEGDRGFLVDTVQYFLLELERLYGFDDYTPSGVYDQSTAETVRTFQRRNLINATGNVDRETWDALAIQHNILLGGDE